MDSGLLVGCLCFAAVALSILWLHLLKRQARLRRERKIGIAVDKQLAYEKRLADERRRRQG